MQEIHQRVLKKLCLYSIYIIDTTTCPAYVLYILQIHHPLSSMQSPPYIGHVSCTDQYGGVGAAFPISVYNVCCLCEVWSSSYCSCTHTALSAYSCCALWGTLYKLLLCVFSILPSTSEGCRGGLSLEESIFLVGVMMVVLCAYEEVTC